MVTRRCTTCKEEKSLDQFYNNKADKKFGKETRCKVCSIKHLREWEAKNPGTQSKRAYKFRLKNEYGLTLDQYDTMYRNQNGVCKVCQKPNLNGQRLHVDHDHATKRIRGLLCGNCNRAAGCLKDSIELCYKLADYLENVIKVRTLTH